MSIRPAPDWRLYLVTDTELSGGLDRVPEMVRRAVRGGVGVVQVRDKHATDAEFTKLALAVGEVLADHRRDTGVEVPLFVNDRVEIAQRLGMHVHIGQSDQALAETRALLGPGPMIGLSIDTAEQLEQAIAYANDDPTLRPGVVGIGPVWATPTKADAAPALGIEGLATIAARAKTAGIPSVAIGGINRDNAESVAATEVSGLCVVSAIVAADDPQRAASELIERIDRARSRP